MAIRQRTPEDFPAVASLLAAVHLPAKGLERTEGWVCELDGQVAGHVALESTLDAAVIRSLVVAAARQGQGLGAQLLDLAEAQAGARTVVLKTDSIGPWVQRRGYQPVTLAEVPASVLATTQFEGSLCAGYPVFMRSPGAVIREDMPRAVRTAQAVKETPTLPRKRWAGIVPPEARTVVPEETGTFLGWKGEQEGRPVPRLGLRPDPAAVPVDDPLDDGQPDARALEVGDGMEPLEGVE